MNSSDNINSRFASTLRDAKIFFSSCLSMHMVPILFALIFIVVADQKSNSRKADSGSPKIVESKAAEVPSIENYLLLNPNNSTQVVALYEASRLVMKTIR
jgi:hypothetical protein